MRILIAEDEARLAELIAARLKKDKYTVDIADDGIQGMDEALSGVYDLVILDVMMPGHSGFEILQAMKEEGIDAKVIMLTARSQLEDKLTGLKGGADDYVTKPFHLEELAARVNVQLRKKGAEIPSNEIKAGDLLLQLNDSRLSCPATGQTIDIAGKEYQLLEIFMRNPGQVLTRDQLYAKVWGLDTTVESNNLEAYLSFLRRKLKAIGSKSQLKAVRGLGYRLESPDEEA